MMTESSAETDVFADALQRARQLAQKIGNAEKRALENEDELVAKRPNNGMMMGTPIGTVAGVGLGIPGLDPVVVEHMFIPDHMVGLVIGRSGEQISGIQMQSQCRVQMAPDSGGMAERQVTLTGTKNSIEQAKMLIQQVMASKCGGASSNIYQRTAAAGASGHGNHVVEMSLPGPKVGLVIGKSGENLKRIQDELGVRMIVVQDSNMSSMGDKPLRIIGPPDMCEVARQRIMEKLASRDDNIPFRGGGGGGGQFGFSNSYGGGDKSLGEVIVPRIAVGVIIGKGGEMIKRLQMETGAKVQFKIGEDPNASERTAVLTGSSDSIQKATQMITELVNQAIMKQGGGGGGGSVSNGVMSNFGGNGSRMGSGGFGGSEVFYMHVPATKTGLVIGKGGETIRQISQDSGAQVELSRDAASNEFEKIFIIRGTSQQIHHALHMIRIRVGDVAAGTPMPPFNGMSNPEATNSGGFGYGFNYNHTPVQPAQPAQDPNTAAWAAYYQYYQQQQQQQAAAAAASAFQQQQAQAAAAAATPQQATAAQPTINPQTGQADYSAQWAEYYRALGMHDQAALIEQQAKTAQGTQQSAQAAQAQPQQAAYAAYTQQQQAAAQYGYPQAQQFAQPF